jgi:lipoprotein-anchoring transpeptidase ErfK/SrfK
VLLRRPFLLLAPLLVLAALLAAQAPAPAAVVPVAKKTAATPCAKAVRACVDLSARRAWLTDGAGHVTRGPVPALGGRPGEPTPVGTFSVSHKVVNYHSREFDAPMPYSVFFVPGVAFHQGSLTVLSAGCVHLSRADAQAFFAALNPGDAVQVVQ